MTLKKILRMATVKESILLGLALKSELLEKDKNDVLVRGKAGMGILNRRLHVTKDCGYTVVKTLLSALTTEDVTKHPKRVRRLCKMLKVSGASKEEVTNTDLSELLTKYNVVIKDV